MTEDIVDLINRKLEEMEQNLIFLKKISYEITVPAKESLSYISGRG